MVLPILRVQEEESNSTAKTCVRCGAWTLQKEPGSGVPGCGCPSQTKTPGLDGSGPDGLYFPLTHRAVFAAPSVPHYVKPAIPITPQFPVLKRPHKGPSVVHLFY